MMMIAYFVFVPFFCVCTYACMYVCMYVCTYVFFYGVYMYIRVHTTSLYIKNTMLMFPVHRKKKRH